MLRRLAEFSPYLKIALPVSVVLFAAVAGVTRGVATALLILAASALLLAITLLWNSVQGLDDQSELTLDDAMALGAPSAEEERKRSVLRALKDLEYERSVGKITEEDYATLSTRYRAEAKALLRSLAEAELPVRERVEKRLAVRLKRAGIDPLADDPKEPKSNDARDSDRDSDPNTGDSDSDARDSDGELAADARDSSADDRDSDEPRKSKSKAIDTEESSLRCETCNTENDLDARFCKSCGEVLA